MNEVEPYFEIERRFFVDDPSVTDGADWTLITQAYVFSHEGWVVRVRLKQYPDETGRLTQHSAFVAIKGPRVQHTRAEDEHPFNFELASEIVARSNRVVIKKRYSFMANEVPWEVDEFQGMNYGLVIAEVELDGSDPAASSGVALDEIPIPAWLGPEIINRPEFDNENLAANPVSQWPDKNWRR